LWNGFGEVVSVMEWDPCCSIDNLYGECESWFLETIGVELSKEQKDVDKKIYMKLAKEEKEAELSFWGVGEVKFWFF
jgi:hypothetical protein